MIQLEHLHIEDFRGIRYIDLPLDSKSFVVHGPNGSGKSGVVDAIDFALTGTISRLTGAGTGGVTLLKHGPHVHKRDDPAAAVVELTVCDVDSGEKAVLRRGVKRPAEFTLDPDTPTIRAALAQAQAHPELTLSRREIIKYVVAKPADRAQQVQALLKLDHLDSFRKLLQGTSTRASRSFDAADTERKTAENSFRAHLDLGEQLLATEIAREINKRRRILGLEEFTEVSIDSEFAQGVDGKAEQPTFNLSVARREVGALIEATSDTESLQARQDAFSSAIETIANDPTLLDALRHRQLVEAGVQELVDATCPLCDHEWPSPEDLRRHLTEKLERSAAAGQARKTLLESAQAYQQALRTLKESVDRAIAPATSHGDGSVHHLLANYSSSLNNHIQMVAAQPESVVTSAPSLTAAEYEASAEVASGLEALKNRLDQEPDQSARTDAHTFLTIAQDRWARVRVARAQEAKARAVRDSAKRVYEVFCSTADSALETLYATVQTDFSRYYRAINAEDEGDFTAQLKPDSGSLELTVDFYGLGRFPPTAYHSEGHQDGMGVCLYLALVRQLLGDKFRYAVLDDVVMSVDINHREQFCKLLGAEFPEVQFIITTHDPVWARQMQSAGLIAPESQARFYGWTVDGGPVYEQGDVWRRIDEDLKKEDVTGAAHKLRRRLEAAAADLAHLMGGSVPYRGDNNYALSVLISAVNARHRDLLKLAAAAAESWKDQEAKDLVAAKKAARAAVISDQEAEAWILNPLVHNNDWINNVSANDFKPVLQATKEYLGLFMCDKPSCTGWIYVTGGHTPENLRCACLSYNLNLKKK